MQLSKGTLLLVKSKNPPVFGTSPVAIEYMRAPRKGEGFLFRRAGSTAPLRLFECCNLSVVQKISRLEDLSVIKTLNSVYVLLKK